MFAYDNFRSTACSIEMMKHLYILNFFCTFGISGYPLLLETVSQCLFPFAFTQKAVNKIMLAGPNYVNFV